MWPFKSKSSFLSSGLLEGLTDWHSHILPGVDDGIESLDQSLELLAAFEKAGIKKIWLTPHIMEDIPNCTASLKQRFETLRSEWKGKVELRLASENMLDSLFEERLTKGDLLPIGEDGKHLLTETSYYTPPLGLDEKLSSIQKIGYHVILAHPERYSYMDEKDYMDLKRRGILFQLNLLSVIGGYGNVAEKKAKWLLKKGFVDYLGSDIHRLGHFNDFIDINRLNTKTVKQISDVKVKFSR